MSKIENKYRSFRDLDHVWLKSQAFRESTVSDWLERSQKFLAYSHSSKPAAWVLDLDSTLFCVSTRLRMLFADFMAHHNESESWWGQILAHLTPGEHRYGVRSTFRGILEKFDSLGAKEKSARLWALFEPYWSEGFFSDRYISYDRAYPGASEFVSQLHAMGFHIVYLTGRDSPRTLSGTYAALKSNRFPLGAHTRLLIKPHRDLPDLAFKESVARQLAAQYEVFALIDNEPENLCMFAEKFPSAEVIFFHSIMSPRIPKQNFKELLGMREMWRMQSFD